MQSFTKAAETRISKLETPKVSLQSLKKCKQQHPKSSSGNISPSSLTSQGVEGISSPDLDSTVRSLTLDN